MTAGAPPTIAWNEADGAHAARWRSEAGWPVPRRVQLADDTLPADAAYRLVCEGTALLWRGDFHNARQLLQALARRVDRKATTSPPRGSPVASLAERFHQHRQAQGRRARLLGMLLIELDASHGVDLRRAPDLRSACTEAWGEGDGPSVTSLRELQALVGAHEWRKKGVQIPALNGAIHPHYGVFSPVRGEYLDLVAQAPLPTLDHAVDVGTGTGVLAAVLARRGVKRVTATDVDDRALACARENMERLGLTGTVQVVHADLFPVGRAPLLVCNPPWVPARPTSPVEGAVYDEGSRMLRGYLAGLTDHLSEGGEGWLVLSDLAEHLGLRSREELLSWIAAAGLRVLGRSDIRPRHGKASDTRDALHAARAAEVTSLWRLCPA
jgi:methylase of polypeptide subunit release factors